MILNFAQECLLYNIFFLLCRPFVSNLYEVVSVDINYFFQYGQEVWYKANHKRAEQTYKGVSNAAELAFIKGDDIQGWCCLKFIFSSTHKNESYEIRKRHSRIPYE